MIKITDIQKDLILFSILLVFLGYFYYYWCEKSKEPFIDIQMMMIQPVPGLRFPSWTNSMINSSKNKILWKDLIFNTNDKVNLDKNSEFSLSFWLFLGVPKSREQPLFRIIDLPQENSPGVWLTENNIQIKNGASYKKMKLTQIHTQSLDFYTIVFTAYNYSIYINGKLTTTEEWGSKPAKINDVENAFIEIATASTKSHYAMKDVKIYDQVFTADTVYNLYKSLRKNDNYDQSERKKVTNAMDGLNVWPEIDWVYPLTEGTYYTLSENNLVGDWSTTNIKNSTTMSISFWIDISNTHDNWRSIFHVSNTNNNCCNAGDRVPAMWICPGSTQVHIKYSSVTNGNDGPECSLYQIPLNTPTFITIVLNSSTLNLYANGVSQFTHQFESPLIQAKSDAKFYMADPWHATGGFQIKDFRLYNDAFSGKYVSDLYSASGGIGDVAI